MSLIGPLLKLESHLKCELCHGLLSDARTLKECGHRFCRRCVFDKIGKERQCPTCELPAIVKNLRPDPMYDTLVACVRKLGTLLSDVQTVDSNALYRSSFRNTADASLRNASMSGTETQTPSPLRRVSTDEMTESRRLSGSLDMSLLLRRQSSNGTETQTPSLLKHGSDEELLRNDRISGTETPSILQSNSRLSETQTQTPSLLLHRSSSEMEATNASDGRLLRNDRISGTGSLRKRASSEVIESKMSGTGTHTPSLLKRTSSEILLRDEPPRLQRCGSSDFLHNGCGSALLRDFMPAEVELSRREAVHEEPYMPSLLHNDDLCDRYQASDDSQEMVLTDPEVSDNDDIFDDQDKISETSDICLSNPDGLVEEFDAYGDALPDDELPRQSLKRNLSATINNISKKRRTDPEDFIDPVEVICGSSQESDIMQALCDSKDGLPEDEMPRKQVEDVRSSPEDLLTAMFESKDDLPEDEMPRKQVEDVRSSPEDLLTAMFESKDDLPDDELPRKRVEDTRSSPEDLLTAMFESKDDLPDDEIPPERRLKSKQKDTQPKQLKTIPPPPSPAQPQAKIEEPKKTTHSPAQEKWECPHCYFMNMHESRSCNLCKQSRGTTPHVPIPPSIPQHEPLGMMGSVVPTSQWQQDQYASPSAEPSRPPLVIFTGVPTDEAEESIANAVANGLDISYIESDDPTRMGNVTHIVTHRNADGLSGRTVKYLGGILNGIWIVDISWLVDCSKAKQWLPEQRYEVLGDTVTGVTHGPRRGRMQKDLKKERLFHGIRFNFFDKAHPQREKLVKLCQAGGGELLRRRPPADKSGAWRDHELERSTINPEYPVIIVTDKKQLEKKSAKGLQLYQVRESQWLLDRISKCSLAT